MTRKGLGKLLVVVLRQDVVALSVQGFAVVEVNVLRFAGAPIGGQQFVQERKGLVVFFGVVVLNGLVQFELVVGALQNLIVVAAGRQSQQQTQCNKGGTDTFHGAQTYDLART